MGKQIKMKRTHCLRIDRYDVRGVTEWEKRQWRQLHSTTNGNCTKTWTIHWQCADFTKYLWNDGLNDALCRDGECFWRTRFRQWYDSRGQEDKMDEKVTANKSWLRISGAIQWTIKWGHVCPKTNTKYELKLLIRWKIIVVRRRTKGIVGPTHKIEWMIRSDIWPNYGNITRTILW